MSTRGACVDINVKTTPTINVRYLEFDQLPVLDISARTFGYKANERLALFLIMILKTQPLS